MNKKGFTIIEIIVVIALVAVIGTSGVVGFNIINKNIRINKLSQITDNVLKAAEVYIETNKETKTQIYTNKNGAVIPLNVLVDEGLLTLDYTDLTKDDIKDEYVITMLSEEKGDCIDLKTKTSWNESSNEPIYICGYNELKQEIEKIKAKLDEIGPVGNTTNVLSEVIIENAKNATGFDNATIYKEESAIIRGVDRFLSKTKDDYGDTYYFKGEVIDNFVNFAEMCWRIVRVEGNGSIKLILEDKENGCHEISGTVNSIIGTGKYGNNSSNKIDYLTPDDPNNSMVTAFYNFQTTTLESYLSKLESGNWCGYYYPDLKCYNSKNLFSTFSNGDPMFVATLNEKEARNSFLVQGSSTSTSNRYKKSFLTNYKEKTEDWLLLVNESSSNCSVFETFNRDDWYTFDGSEFDAPNFDASIFTYSPDSSGYGFRPTIRLIPKVKIKKGRGTINNPYVIDMD